MIVALFIVVTTSVVFYNVRATNAQRGTAVLVNANARQRPLVQRYMKDVLLSLDSQDADPGKTAAMLHANIDALLNGGKVLAPRAQDVYVNIKGTTDREVRRKLVHQRTLIGTFTKQGSRLLAEGQQAPGYKADLHKLLVEGAQLSAVTNDVVGQITQDAESSLAHLIWVEVILGSLGAVAAVAMGAALRRDGVRQSARFRSLVHNSSDLITVVDEANRITYQSPSSQRILGYPPGDVVGKPVLDFIHPNDQGELLEQLIDALTGSGTSTASFETRIRNRAGAWLTFQGTATNLLRDRTVRGVVLNARDVTDAKRAAAELAEARDIALDASLMKGQFLATMSHEIRTPMNAVIGLTELLMGTELNGEQRQYAAGVHDAGEGLLGLINDILDFSKIEAGKIELEDADLDLRAVAEGAASLLGDAAGAKGLELLVHCYPGVPGQLRGDPTRLRQVLVNLVSNAVKFTAVGEVILRVEAIGNTASTCVVRFEVTDSGIGIAAEDQARLFEPFSQADASTTRKYGGTGLGLAITKQLIELMGGELTVNSEPDTGSTFTFAIPFTKPVDQNAPKPANADLMANLHALIVDDNATNRLILTQQLRSWGMSTVEAVDGREALERLREAAATKPFDVAILDFNMPGMDGLELARTVKADPAIAHAHLFLLSSSGERLNRDAAHRAGLDGSMTKPVRQSELYDCLIDGLVVTTPDDPPTIQPDAAATTGRILLVEDNQMNQLVASRILAKLGYTVDIANNGQEAVTVLTGQRYDAVLMDCQMPVMDGYQATTEIRRIEGDAQHTPIIAMTAAAMEGDREICLAAGMDDYLTKPIRVDTLARTLAPWITPINDHPPASPPHPEGATMTEPDPQPDPIDPERLDMLRDLDDGDGTLLEAILDAFLTDTTATAADLHRAVNTADPHRVEQCAHSIKGAAANVGADRLAEICSRIERCGKANQVRDAEPFLPEFDQELQRVRSRVDRVLTGG